MALLLMCGLPASGKSTMAKQLSSLLQADGRTVRIIRDGDDAITSRINKVETTMPPADDTKQTPTLPIDSDDGSSVDVQSVHSGPKRQDMYVDSTREKLLRADLRAMADRALSDPGAFVIVDSLNYIKGFRYELFCAAKTAGVVYGVVFSDTPVQMCEARDAARSEKGDDAYGGELLHALVRRFEHPIATNRWDSPLFTVTAGDIEAGQQQRKEQGQEQSCDEVLRKVVEALRDGGRAKRLSASLSTRVTPVPGADVFAALDAATRRAEAELVARLQTGAAVGQSVAIKGASVAIRLQRKPRVAELREWRRAYVNYSRMHPPVSKGSDALLDEYVQFINEQLRMRR